MINEVTVNSNNAIEMSRGQLLGWLNEMLKTNIAKIQLLGTGAIYCQLLDVLYPTKIPLNKVNFKAKLDYEFVNNFKILQQSFTKLGIMKHIEVERLIKCKYQDNLQFLQWFKKIFDNNGVTGKDYNGISRRKQSQGERKKQKQNSRFSLLSVQSKEMQNFDQNTYLGYIDKSMSSGCASIQTTERNDDGQILKLACSAIKQYPQICNPHNSPSNSFRAFQSPWKDELKQKMFIQEKEIEHLMEQWDENKTSSELIANIRQIMLVAGDVDWTIESGEFVHLSKQINAESQ